MIANNQKGVGLIEVFVALIVLAIAFSSIHMMQIQNHVTMLNLEMEKDSRSSTQQVIDSLYMVGASAITNGTKTIGVGTKAVTINWTSTNAITNGMVNAREVTLIASWRVNNQLHQQTSTIVVNEL